jgi:hypothetical protein
MLFNDKEPFPKKPNLTLANAIVFYFFLLLVSKAKMIFAVKNNVEPKFKK